MTEISYPDLQDVKENIPEVSAISLNTATNTKTKKIGNSTDATKSLNSSHADTINPVFKLGDDTNGREAIKKLY